MKTPEEPAAANQNQAEKEKKKPYDGAFSKATSELLFVLLPFVVIAITLAHRGELRTILSIPEWSIVSAVIIGQTITKLASATLGRTGLKKERIVLVMSILLVCMLVPVLIILAIVLTSPTISKALAVTQAIFFVLSAFLFWAASGGEGSAQSPS